MTTKTRTPKRLYQPPQLEEVQLVAEEAVLQSCKTKQTVGPYPTSCFGDQGDKCSFPGT